MNNITIYNFNQNQVRTQIIDGEPWFCLADTCAALHLKQTRSDRLPAKGLTVCHTLTNGGQQELTFINEPNLYRLIFRSNKPQAQAFADWVYTEVLPSIRKTGGYGVPAVDTRAVVDELEIRKAKNMLTSVLISRYSESLKTQSGLIAPVRLGVIFILGFFRADDSRKYIEYRQTSLWV